MRTITYYILATIISVLILGCTGSRNSSTTIIPTPWTYYYEFRIGVNQFLKEVRMQDNVDNRDYCVFDASQRKMLIIKDPSSFTLYRYQKEQFNYELESSLTIDSTEENDYNILQEIFAWTDSVSLYYPVIETDYNPLYWYFQLCNSMGEVKLGFLVFQTMRPTQSQILPEYLRKSLPFTQNQLIFIIRQIWPDLDLCSGTEDKHTKNSYNS